MILFADDTNIFVSGPNINELCLSMNTELSKLSQWFKLNKLSLILIRLTSLYLNVGLKV